MSEAAGTGLARRIALAGYVTGQLVALTGWGARR
jgi:hypothetical protein